MRDQKFDQAFAYTVSCEKGFVNDPVDRGGPTKYGITMRTLARWRSPKPVTVEDVQNLAIEESKDIYFAWYWCPAGCDRIQNVPVAMAIFDMSVLMGAHTAVLYSQMALSQVLSDQPAAPTPDGRMGPNTVAILNKFPPSVFLPAYRDLLLKRCKDIVESHPEQIRFLGGWKKRINALPALHPVEPLVS